MGVPKEWTTAVVRVPTDVAEVAAERLWAFGPTAIEERSGPDQTVLLAGFDDVDRAAEARDAMDEAGLGVVELAPVVDDGLDGWRRWARVELAPPFVIVPSWLDGPEPVTGQRVLRIDPARTFGSGSHPTTRLVLGRLAELVEPGAAVLDVGCGSGILAVGAALLGAASVLGIDVDPGSPTATSANAAANGVTHLVTTSTATVADMADRSTSFHVVAANLSAPVIVDLAGDLARVLSPGGALVVSGLLADQWEATTALLPDLAVTEVAVDEGWAAITLRPVTER